MPKLKEEVAKTSPAQMLLGVGIMWACHQMTYPATRSPAIFFLLTPATTGPLDPETSALSMYHLDCQYSGEVA